MAYSQHNLSVLAYANGFTLWHYISPDDSAELDTAGYFDSAADMLRVGDMIIANVRSGGSPDGGIYLVTYSQEATIGTNCLMRMHQPSPPQVASEIAASDLARAVREGA